jgi:hypothetical protein
MNNTQKPSDVPVGGLWLLPTSAEGNQDMVAWSVDENSKCFYDWDVIARGEQLFKENANNNAFCCSAIVMMAMKREFDDLLAAERKRAESEAWQLIATAPHDRHILVWNGTNQFVASALQEQNSVNVGWVIVATSETDCVVARNVTHWKECPPPPVVQ